jgi:hypothetical protein
LRKYESSDEKRSTAASLRVAAIVPASVGSVSFKPSFFEGF